MKRYALTSRQYIVQGTLRSIDGTLSRQAQAKAHETHRAMTGSGLQVGDYIPLCDLGRSVPAQSRPLSGGLIV